MIPCKQWRDCGIRGGGCCAAGRYDRPSVGVCLTVCTHYEGPPRVGLRRALLANQLPLQRPRHAQVLVSGQPQPAYLGDRMGTVIGNVTGRKPCRICKKIEVGINTLDRGVRKLVTGTARPTRLRSEGPEALAWRYAVPAS